MQIVAYNKKIKMKASSFYAIWFSQRNGSSLLCKALESTGLLGKPSELFTLESNEKLLNKHESKSYEHLQERIYELGSSSNGVFGIKLNAPKKENDPLIHELKEFPIVGNNATLSSNFAVWEKVFPNCKHIFLTRRNKVRQAVSWWKAIMTNEWHRKSGEQSNADVTELVDKYNFDAIKHLLIETSIRESKIQAFLNEGKCSALTIVYEDFIKNYKGTVKQIGNYIGVDIDEKMVDLPYYSKLADEISDEWTEKFRIELQKDWTNKIW